MAGKPKKMKALPMEHNNNNFIVGILCGISGGMIKYYAQINDVPFLIKIMEAGITALICGGLGALGKHLVDRYIIKNKKIK